MSPYSQMTDIKSYLNENKNLVDDFIKSYMEERGYSKKFSCNNFSIGETMIYSLSNGGKRIRPVLLMLVAEGLGFNDKKKLLPFASSLEFIHSYSLIHDDLPAMDNDSIRRGKPTNHIVYGEASAILAGDALLTEAFVILSNEKYTGWLMPGKSLRLINELSGASSAGGLAGGQFLDVNSFNSILTMEEIEIINREKTGRLIEAACVMGAILSDGENDAIENIRRFGSYVGLTFQIVDDILDLAGNREITGKTVGIDKINKKCNLVGTIGMEKSLELVNRYNEKAAQALAEAGIKNDMIMDFVNYLTNRIS